MKCAFDLFLIDQMSIVKYAIFWKYLDNSWKVSPSGNGDYILTLEMAKELCEKMNKEFANTIHHWPVSEETLDDNPVN